MTKEEIAKSARKPTTGCLSTVKWLLQAPLQTQTFLRQLKFAWRDHLSAVSEIDFSTDRFKTNGQVGWAMSELVDYKCALCGTIENFDRERNGIHCSHCGCKIFMKLAEVAETQEEDTQGRVNSHKWSKTFVVE